MASVCEHCGEAALDEEEEVCRSCGAVSEGMQFDTTFNVFCSDTQTTLHKWTRNKKSIALDYGRDMLNLLCNQFSVSADLKSNTSDLLQEVYSSKVFRNRQDVGVLAGCCLIHKLKEQQVYVSINDLSKKLKCSRKSVFKYSKVLNAYLKNQTESLPFRIKVEKPDLDCKLDFEIRALFESASMEKKDIFILKTKALVELGQSCWITTGRSVEGAIIAAAFFCWKSMNPSRRYLSFTKFCSEFSLPYSKGLPRVSELKSMLLKLGRNIPSITENYVNEKNVIFHLDYILENSESLRNDLLKDEFTAEEVNKKEFSSFRKIRGSKKRRVVPMPQIKTEDQCADDVEISDTEISSYIRSEEQVKLITSLMEKKV